VAFQIKLLNSLSQRSEESVKAECHFS